MVKNSGINFVDTSLTGHWSGIEDFDLVLGGELAQFGLSYGAPDQLRENLTAAAIAYAMMLSSIDYTKKRYVEGLELGKNSEADRYSKTIYKCRKQIATSFRDILNGTANCGAIGRENMGFIAANFALIRLESSFRSVVQLVKLGFYIEALIICRLILEQIAWIFDVHEKDQKELFKSSTTKSISRINKLIPEFGRLYGHLSNWAHIAPHLAPNYVVIGDEMENNVGSILSSLKKSLPVLILLLHLLDFMWIAAEYVWRNDLGEWRCLKKWHGDIVAKVHRPMHDITKSYARDIMGAPNPTFRQILDRIYEVEV